MGKDPYLVFRMRLRELRAVFGLSQEELAEQAGLNYKHYQEIERGGKREVRFSTFVKIADAFGIPLQHLFSDESPAALFREADPLYKTKKKPKTQRR